MTYTGPEKRNKERKKEAATTFLTTPLELKPSKPEAPQLPAPRAAKKLPSQKSPAGVERGYRRVPGLLGIVHTRSLAGATGLRGRGLVMRCHEGDVSVSASLVRMVIKDGIRTCLEVCRGPSLGSSSGRTWGSGRSWWEASQDKRTQDGRVLPGLLLVLVTMEEAAGFSTAAIVPRGSASVAGMVCDSTGQARQDRTGQGFFTCECPC
jgi:hypothetical protein